MSEDVDNEKKAAFKNEVDRLARLSRDDGAFELKDVASQYRVGVTDLRSAVKARRQEIKMEQKAAARAEMRSQTQFDIGSNVEISQDFVKSLRRLFDGNVVFDEGQFWGYRVTEWQPIELNELHMLVHSYDGVYYGTLGAQIKLDTNKIKSIITETAYQLEHKGFFADAPRGVNCLDGFITFDPIDGSPTLLPHSPKWRTRHTMQASWQPGHVDLSGSLLDDFLSVLWRSFKEPDRYRDLLQEMIGAVISESATAIKQPLCFIMTEASANNGKSTLIRLFRLCLPPSAVASISPSTLKKQEYVVNLAGKLLNTSDELSTHALESDIFKQLIDGKNDVAGRHLYKGVSTFRPKALHIYAAQHTPKFHGGIDRGVRRRIVIIDFAKSIPLNDMMMGIEDKIIEKELDLMLAWAVEGAGRLISNQGYNLPSDINDAAERWVRENDSVAAWIDARVRFEQSQPATLYPTGYTVYSHYRQWCKSWEIAHPFEKTEFYRKWNEQFPHIDLQHRTSASRRQPGVVLLDADHSDQAEQYDPVDGSTVVSNVTFRSGTPAPESGRQSVKVSNGFMERMQSD